MLRKKTLRNVRNMFLSIEMGLNNEAQVTNMFVGYHRKGS